MNLLRLSEGKLMDQARPQSSWKNHAAEGLVQMMRPRLVVVSFPAKKDDCAAIQICQAGRFAGFGEALQQCIVPDLLPGRLLRLKGQAGRDRGIRLNVSDEYLTRLGHEFWNQRGGRWRVCDRGMRI